MSRSRLRIPEPYRKMARTARRRRWKLSAAGNGHLKWQPPDGRPVFTAGTPSPGGARDDLAKLRKAGLNEKEKA